MTTEQLAAIVDECSHGLTSAFCPDCSRQTRLGERIARRRRQLDERAWGVDDPLPYRKTVARYGSACGGGCGDPIDEGDTIFNISDAWWCRECAEDYRALRGDDG